MSLISTANQLAAASPVAKKHSTEQPKGTHALWNDLWLAKSPVTVGKQSYGEEQRFCVLSGHLNYKILEVIIEFLPNDTKNKLPTPALMMFRFFYKFWLNAIIICAWLNSFTVYFPSREKGRWGSKLISVRHFLLSVVGEVMHPRCVLLPSCHQCKHSAVNPSRLFIETCRWAGWWFEAAQRRDPRSILKDFLCKGGMGGVCCVSQIRCKLII